MTLEAPCQLPWAGFQCMLTCAVFVLAARPRRLSGRCMSWRTMWCIVTKGRDEIAFREETATRWRMKVYWVCVCCVVVKVYVNRLCCTEKCRSAMGRDETPVGYWILFGVWVNAPKRMILPASRTGWRCWDGRIVLTTSHSFHMTVIRIWECFVLLHRAAILMHLPVFWTLAGWLQDFHKCSSWQLAEH